ncbi:OLC1v1013555C1 [Oldenlandia corymbosa var. corymbosa]|uniref:OLC1v1013555C1 n=1 Tax=Oldenlandia corymbosa var. corymbosa TaxID=529605 RepID=A0AAV1DYH9_OLDCO|nr:OLC1v1013555C1 [Oldenlandia corymbosa var. corymbosa]
MDSAQKRNIPISEGALIPSADPVVPENANDLQEVPGEAYVTPPVQTSVSSSKTPDDGSHITIPSVNSTAQSGTPAVTPPIPQLAEQRYIVDINGLVPTKTIHFNIVVRVMTIWKMYDTQNKKDGSKIQATIPARIMKDFVKYFKDEGVCRRLSRFDHCLNINGGYRCSKHEYKIVFGSDTLVEQAVDLDIPNNVFEYTPFAEITNFVANFDYCCDLIGHIIGYSDPIVEKGKKRISVQLEDERADTLKVTLWEEHADRVLNCMNNEPEYPVVLIVQYVKCKKYYSKVSATTNLFNGRIYLNDMNIADIYEYKHRMEQEEIKSARIQKISLLSSISGYTTFEDFVRDAEMLTLSGISELDQILSSNLTAILRHVGQQIMIEPSVTLGGEPVGFEGKMWAEFHDLYFNHLRGVNDISASDSSEGEVDTIDYIRSNSDQNTFNEVMNTDVIQRGRLEIPWHIVRRLDIQDYNSLIIYYDEEPVIRMGRVYLSDYPNRFIVEGDIEYMMGLKRIPTGIKLGFHIDARKAVNKEHLILEVL